MIKSLILSLVQPRVVCAIGIVLAGYALFNDAYIEKLPPRNGPYLFLFMSMITGNVVGVYLIENHDAKWQLFVGHFVLYTFFIVGFGGAFFGW